MPERRRSSNETPSIKEEGMTIGLLRKNKNSVSVSRVIVMGYKHYHISREPSHHALFT
jgi:hypothetical protein